MAVQRTRQQIIQEKLGKFPATVIYIILEWLLIIVLFLDGLLAFAANEFARFFGMKMPCLLCNRIDHALVPRDPDFFYNDSICEAHRKDVSSLAYCHIHKKLSDVRRMCKGCLLSFASENRLNSENNQSALEITGYDESRIRMRLHVRGEEGELLIEKSNIRRCSCCNEPLRTRSPYLRRLVRMLSNGSEMPETPGGATIDFGKESYMMMGNDDSLGFHPLSHINYRELRLTSDTESEIAEDDDISSTLASDNDAYKDEVMDQELKKMVENLDKTVSSSSEDQLHLLEPDDISRKGNLDRSTATVALDSSQNAGCETDTGELLSHAGTGDAEASESVDWKILETDAPKASAAASDSGLSLISKKMLVEKDESTESLKESIMKKVPGESLLHRLKRQVRLDRKSLIALCTELDQERSASAVAANEAMAMINRLQEEKAAVQMEALQYQRMMEEQAEYDQEALVAMKKLLLKREKEVKSLEEELESYRERYEWEFTRDEGSGSGDNEGTTVPQDYEGYKALLNRKLQKMSSRSHSFDSLRFESRAFG